MSSSGNSPDFWDNLKTDAMNFWQTVEGDAVTIGKNLAAVVKADVPIILKQLEPICYNLVAGFAAAEFSQLTGGQKAAAVDTALLATAKAQSLALLPQDAAMLRQQVVNVLGLTAPTTGG